MLNFNKCRKLCKAYPEIWNISIPSERSLCSFPGNPPSSTSHLLFQFVTRDSDSVLKLQINGVVQHMPFCARLLSPRMFLKFIHVCIHTSFLFIVKIKFCCMNMLQFVSLSLVDFLVVSSVWLLWTKLLWIFYVQVFV